MVPDIFENKDIPLLVAYVYDVMKLYVLPHKYEEFLKILTSKLNEELEKDSEND